MPNGTFEYYPHIRVMITAYDKASGQFRRLGDVIGGTGNKFGVFGNAVKASIIALAGFATKLGILPIALHRLVPFLGAAFLAYSAFNLALDAPSIVRAGARIIDYRQALRRATIQMTLAGMTWQDASARVSTFARTLDRTTATSIFQNVQATEALIKLGPTLSLQLLDWSERLSTLTGLDPVTIFAALADVLLKKDWTPVETLFGGMERFDAAVKSLKSGNVAGFFSTLLDTIKASEPSITDVERLEASLERLSELSLPAIEIAVQLRAGIALVLVDSLVTALERVEEDPEVILGAGILGYGVASHFLTGIKGGIAAGLIGIFVAAFVTGFPGIKDAIIEDPNVLLVIGGAAVALGTYFANRFVGGAAAALLLLLAPGIEEALKGMATQELLLNALYVFGFVVGSKIGGWKGALAGFAVAFNIVDAIKKSVEEEDWTVAAEKMGMMAVGAAIGFAIGKSAGSAFMGAMIASMFSWENIVAFMKAYEEWYDRMFDKLVSFGWELGLGIAKGLYNALLSEMPGWMKWILGQFGVGPVEEKEGALLPGEHPIPPGWVSRQLGGWVPGPIGKPVPILAHGGEYISPAGGAGMPIIVQLVLDRKVIGEVAIDAVRRTARFGAGMTHGGIGGPRGL